MEPEKVYYSIAQVSQLTGVSLPTLRYWEKEIAQLHPKTNEHQTRFYTTDDIELIRRIKNLREEQHLSLTAIRNLLNNSRPQIDRRQRIIDRLTKIRQELVELRDLM